MEDEIGCVSGRKLWDCNAVLPRVEKQGLHVHMNTRLKQFNRGLNYLRM